MSYLLKMAARSGVLSAMDADGIEKLMSAESSIPSGRKVAKDDEDSGWRTLEGGAKVHFSDKGGGGSKGGAKIDKGPANMKGKTMKQVKAEGKAQTAARRAAKAVQPKAAAVPKSAGASGGKKYGLSAYFQKKSVAKRDSGEEKKFSAAVAKGAEATKKALDAMKPGTVLRFNERGYSLYTKQKEGSWTYQNAFSSSAGKIETDTIVSDIQGYKNPKTGALEPQNAIKGISIPKKGEAGRNAEWDARRALANLEPNPGDGYTGKKVSLQDAMKNAAERAKNGYPKEKGNASAEYTKVEKSKDGKTLSAGVPVGKLTKGSGVTGISKDDISAPNPDDRVYNSFGEHCIENANGQLVLTPEREKLHQEIMEETFANAQPVKPGEKKVFTMLGGGSAAGKGTIQKMMPQLFNQDSPVIDADEMKKRIPEYVDTSFSPDHESAASLAHEESSALAKRAMQTAFCKRQVLFPKKRQIFWINAKVCGLIQ